MNRSQGTHQIEIERNVWHKGPEPKTRKTIQMTPQKNRTAWHHEADVVEQERTKGEAPKPRPDLARAGSRSPLHAASTADRRTRHSPSSGASSGTKAPAATSASVAPRKAEISARSDSAEGTSTALHFRSQGPRSHRPSSFPVPRFQHRAHPGSPGRGSPARLTDQSGRSWIRRRGKPWVPRRRHTPSRRAPGARLPGLPRPPPAALRPPAAPGHAARSGTRFPSAYSPKVFARVR